MNEHSKIEKVGGAGLDIDLGSGFWMGKELLIKLSFNKNEEHDESEFNDLLNMTLNSFNTNELNLGIDQVMQSNDRYRKIASLSSGILELGENGNEIAISIIQQSSQHIADMILFLCDQISYINDELILIANGSIMNNEFYRKSLSDALIFDFSTSLEKFKYSGSISFTFFDNKSDKNSDWSSLLTEIGVILGFLTLITFSSSPSLLYTTT